MKIISKNNLIELLKKLNVKIEIENIKINSSKIISIKKDYKLQLKKCKNNCYYIQLLKY